MVDKYIAQGTPLSEYQLEVAINLIEELGETIQAITKTIRFGIGDLYPDKIENTEKIGLELGDVKALVDMSIECGLVNQSDIDKGNLRKINRLKQYMQKENIL